MKDALELHYGKEGIQCLFEFDISAALIFDHF